MKIENVREKVFHAVAPQLFSNHDNGQLYAKLTETTGRITYIAFQPIKFTSTHHMITRMLWANRINHSTLKHTHTHCTGKWKAWWNTEKASFKKCYVYQWAVVIHKFKEENFKCKRVLVFVMCSRIFHVCQSDSHFVINLEIWGNWKRKKGIR